jgi:recombination protein RecA
MGIKKVTGDPHIDAVIGQINKTFGRSLVTLGPSREPVKAIPTGSLGLDIGIGVGGIPVGRVVELFGLPSSGKTSLALEIAARYQEVKESLGQKDRWVLVIDLEHSITIDFLTSIGLDPDEVIWCKPNTAEEGFNTLIDLTKTGKIGFAVVDSVDAAQTGAVLKKKVGEDQIGGIAKAMSRLLREYAPLCEETNTTCIFINQVRSNPSPFGGQVTPGGYGLPFYSSVRINALKGKPSPDVPNALRMRVKIVKNKVYAPRHDEIAFDFMYAKGINPYIDLINVAKELGISRFAGQTFKVKWPSGEEETVCSGGKHGVIAELTENPELFEKIKHACLVAGGVLKEEVTDEEPNTGVDEQDDVSTEQSESDLDILLSDN